LVDELLKAGIQPWVTLYHWDLPYALQLRGGWLNPDMPRWFADYTRLVVEKLSDRVSNWMTLNEIQVFTGSALQYGHHAPGLKMGLREVLLAGHHALLAHGRAVQTIRATSKQPARIGWAPVGQTRTPASESAAEIEAARQDMFTIHDLNTWNNTWWADPVVLGHYPEDGIQLFGAAVPNFTAEEMKIISAPIDFYGANCYTGASIRAGADGKPERVVPPAGSPVNLYHWYITFDALRWTSRFLFDRYQKPLVITENGLGGMDWVHRDGKVHDPQRVDFLARYLAGLKCSMAEGVPVLGYFHWSLMDNFEWHEGYRQRFGLVYVDFQTQQRILKDSAYWYSEVIKNNGANL
jgi:beta-glucosidase